MSDYQTVKHEFNEWPNVPNGQGVPAKLFKCGFCWTPHIITGPSFSPRSDYMRAIGWKFTLRYGWVCPECISEVIE